MTNQSMSFMLASVLVNTIIDYVDYDNNFDNSHYDNNSNL